jgi:hypothetical protein
LGRRRLARLGRLLGIFRACCGLLFGCRFFRALLTGTLLLTLTCGLLGPFGLARTFLRLLLGRCGFGCRLALACRALFALALRLLCAFWFAGTLLRLFGRHGLRAGLALLLRFPLGFGLRLTLGFPLRLGARFGGRGFAFGLRLTRRLLCTLLALRLGLRLRLFGLLAPLAQFFFRVRLFRLCLRQNHLTGRRLSGKRLRPRGTGKTGRGRLHRNRQRHEGENHPRQQCVLLQHRCFLICHYWSPVLRHRDSGCACRRWSTPGTHFGSHDEQSVLYRK